MTYYTFALWISNEKKHSKISMIRAVMADSDHEAYQKIVEDAYKYYMEDGDFLNRIELIDMDELEGDG